MKKDSVFLEFSDSCNARPLCSHCQGPPFRYSARLGKDQLADLIRKCKQDGLTITVSGGDPSTYPRVMRQIEAAGVQYSLMTNGLKRIADLKPNKVAVSYDAADVRPFDQSNVMPNAISYGAPVTVTTCISRKLKILETYREIQKVGPQIKRWKLSFLVFSGNAKVHPELFPDLDCVFEELAALIQIYVRERPFELFIKGIWHDGLLDEPGRPSQQKTDVSYFANPCTDCPGQKALAVSAKGYVQYCPQADIPIAGLDEPLSEAASKVEGSREYMQIYTEWSECVGCRYFKLCGGGCPAKAKEQTGSWTGRDVLYCNLMRRWEQFILPVLPPALANKLRLKLNAGGKVYMDDYLPRESVGAKSPVSSATLVESGAKAIPASDLTV